MEYQKALKFNSASYIRPEALVNIKKLVLNPNLAKSRSRVFGVQIYWGVLKFDRGLRSKAAGPEVEVPVYTPCTMFYYLDENIVH